MIKNSEVTSWGMGTATPTASSAKKMQEEVQPVQDQRKFGLMDGKAQFLVTNDKATMTYENCGIVVTQNGNIVKGNMHLAADLRDIRINGFWVFNTELLTCLPSTVYSPVPTLKWSTPPYAKSVAKVVSLVG